MDGGESHFTATRSQCCDDVVVDSRSSIEDVANCDDFLCELADCPTNQDSSYNAGVRQVGFSFNSHSSFETPISSVIIPAVEHEEANPALGSQSRDSHSSDSPSQQSSTQIPLITSSLESHEPSWEDSPIQFEVIDSKRDGTDLEGDSIIEEIIDDQADELCTNIISDSTNETHNVSTSNSFDETNLANKASQSLKYEISNPVLQGKLDDVVEKTELRDDVNSVVFVSSSDDTCVSSKALIDRQFVAEETEVLHVSNSEQPREQCLSNRSDKLVEAKLELEIIPYENAQVAELSSGEISNFEFEFSCCQKRTKAGKVICSSCSKVFHGACQRISKTRIKRIRENKRTFECTQCLLASFDVVETPVTPKKSTNKTAEFRAWPNSEENVYSSFQNNSGFIGCRLSLGRMDMTDELKYQSNFLEKNYDYIMKGLEEWRASQIGCTDFSIGSGNIFSRIETIQQDESPPEKVSLIKRFPVSLLTQINDEYDDFVLDDEADRFLANIDLKLQSRSKKLKNGKKFRSQKVKDGVTKCSPNSESGIGDSVLNIITSNEPIKHSCSPESNNDLKRSLSDSVQSLDSSSVLPTRNKQIRHSFEDALLGPMASKPKKTKTKIDPPRKKEIFSTDQIKVSVPAAACPENDLKEPSEPFRREYIVKLFTLCRSHKHDIGPDFSESELKKLVLKVEREVFRYSLRTVHKDDRCLGERYDSKANDIHALVSDKSKKILKKLLKSKVKISSLIKLTDDEESSSNVTTSGGVQTQSMLFDPLSLGPSDPTLIGLVKKPRVSHANTSLSTSHNAMPAKLPGSSVLDNNLEKKDSGKNEVVTDSKKPIIPEMGSVTTKKVISWRGEIVLDNKALGVFGRSIKCNNNANTDIIAGFPKRLEITGRIPCTKVWQTAKVAADHHESDKVVIIRLQCVDVSGQSFYQRIFDYLRKRDRSGLVKSELDNKEIFILPFCGEDKIPECFQQVKLSLGDESTALLCFVIDVNQKKMVSPVKKKVTQIQDKTLLDTDAILNAVASDIDKKQKTIKLEAPGFLSSSSSERSENQHKDISASHTHLAVTQKYDSSIMNRAAIKSNDNSPNYGDDVIFPEFNDDSYMDAYDDDDFPENVEFQPPVLTDEVNSIGLPGILLEAIKKEVTETELVSVGDLDKEKQQSHVNLKHEFIVEQVQNKPPIEISKCQSIKSESDRDHIIFQLEMPAQTYNMPAFQQHVPILELPEFIPPPVQIPLVDTVSEILDPRVLRQPSYCTGITNIFHVLAWADVKIESSCHSPTEPKHDIPFSHEKKIAPNLPVYDLENEAAQTGLSQHTEDYQVSGSSLVDRNAELFDKCAEVNYEVKQEPPVATITPESLPDIPASLKNIQPLKPPPPFPTVAEASNERFASDCTLPNSSDFMFGADLTCGKTRFCEDGVNQIARNTGFNQSPIISNHPRPLLRQQVPRSLPRGNVHYPEQPWNEHIQVRPLFNESSQSGTYSCFQEQSMMMPRHRLVHPQGGGFGAPRQRHQLNNESLFRPQHHRMVAPRIRGFNPDHNFNVRNQYHHNERLSLPESPVFPRSRFPRPLSEHMSDIHRLPGPRFSRPPSQHLQRFRNPLVQGHVRSPSPVFGNPTAATFMGGNTRGLTPTSHGLRPSFSPPLISDFAVRNPRPEIHRESDDMELDHVADHNVTIQQPHSIRTQNAAPSFENLLPVRPTVVESLSVEISEESTTCDEPPQSNSLTSVSEASSPAVSESNLQVPLPTFSPEEYNPVVSNPRKQNFQPRSYREQGNGPRFSHRSHTHGQPRMHSQQQQQPSRGRRFNEKQNRSHEPTNFQGSRGHQNRSENVYQQNSHHAGSGHYHRGSESRSRSPVRNRQRSESSEFSHSERISGKQPRRERERSSSLEDLQRKWEAKRNREESRSNHRNSGGKSLSRSISASSRSSDDDRHYTSANLSIGILDGHEDDPGVYGERNRCATAQSMTDWLSQKKGSTTAPERSKKNKKRDRTGSSPDSHGRNSRSSNHGFTDGYSSDSRDQERSKNLDPCSDGRDQERSKNLDPCSDGRDQERSKNPDPSNNPHFRDNPHHPQSSDVSISSSSKSIHDVPSAAASSSADLEDGELTD